MSESDLVHHEITRAIIGAMYTAHNELGYGFLERVYVGAMSVVLQQQGLHVSREVPFDILFRGVNIGHYRADMVVDSKVLVEVKTGNFIDSAHVAQLRNYMRASGLAVGLLLNFGSSAEFKRLVSTKPSGTPSSAS